MKIPFSFWQTFTCPLLALLFALPVYAQYGDTDEYRIVGYRADAVDNPIADLSARLESGETRLRYRENRGYLDALLDALSIDPHSQILVFSKTSLQYQHISAATPRAVYFSDTTYVGWVQGTDIVEIATMDAKLGLVFYTFDNTREPLHYFNRETQRCLVCHDSNGTMGGGTPLLLAHSSVYSVDSDNLLNVTGEENTTDRTPVRDRWGGWYVTGQHGKQVHLGNLQLADKGELARLDSFRVGNVDTLEGGRWFDTAPYKEATSDIVALMVFEHQLTVQNQISYVKFKAPAVLERLGYPQITASARWDSLPERARQALARMLDKLVDGLLLRESAPLEDAIAGNAEFTHWFQAQGPRDSKGRSLHSLDLKHQLFTYPLSYLVYSRDMDTLPRYARDYVWQSLLSALKNQDRGRSAWSVARQREALEILTETPPASMPRLPAD